MQIVSFLSTQGRRMRYAALPFICGAVIAGLAIPTLTIAQSGKNDAVYRQLGLFGDIFQRVRESYVDEVDDKDLVEAAINGMLTSLDPHSYFCNSDSSIWTIIKSIPFIVKEDMTAHFAT